MIVIHTILRFKISKYVAYYSFYMLSLLVGVFTCEFFSHDISDNILISYNVRPVSGQRKLVKVKVCHLFHEQLAVPSFY